MFFTRAETFADEHILGGFPVVVILFLCLVEAASVAVRVSENTAFYISAR